MFQISQTTFDRLTSVAEDSFVEKLVRFLNEFAPHACQDGPAAVRQSVRALIARARSHDMTSEAAIATYVLTAAHLGLDFPDRFAGAREILGMSVAEQRKSDLLRGFTMSLLNALGA